MKHKLWFWIALLASSAPLCSQRRFHIGPTVDPGVFVLTHVGTCRNGRGFCVLGFNCAVDQDFVGDDLGGNCDGLKTAFNPEASFVCCRENPANYIVKPDPKPPAKEATTQTEPPTEIVTSLVTESETEIFTEIVTKVEEVTEINPVTVIVPEHANGEGELRPGVVIDDPSLVESLISNSNSIEMETQPNKDVKVNCYAAILLGIKCEFSLQESPKDNEVLEKTVRISSPVIDDDTVPDTNWLEIKTTKIDLELERDKVQVDSKEDETLDPTTEIEEEPRTSMPATFPAKEEMSSEASSADAPSSTSTTQATTFEKIEPVKATLEPVENTTSTATTEPEEDMKEDFPSQCGMLGGQSVLQAFGRRGGGIFSDLVASWVTGHSSQREASEFIGGGTVTSTVIYCWMAAIVRNKETFPQGERPDHDQLICTGVLVHTDLVITSAECTIEIIKGGATNHSIVLGDSNLNIDLPFGVQKVDIKDVYVHENYKPFSQFYDSDIGLLRIKSHVQLTSTVCLLCLPSQSRPTEKTAGNCSVVSYGKKTSSNLFLPGNEAMNSMGILRKSVFNVRQFDKCHQLFEQNQNLLDESEFLCAFGYEQDKTEPCLVGLGSGSPMICKSGDRYELSGLVTQRTLCAKADVPALFIDLKKHLKWIEKKYHKVT